jgi:hypothetical protein
MQAKAKPKASDCGARSKSRHPLTIQSKAANKGTSRTLGRPGDSASLTRAPLRQRSRDIAAGGNDPQRFGLGPIQTGGHDFTSKATASQSHRRKGVMEIDPSRRQPPIVEPNLTFGQAEPETLGSDIVNRSGRRHGAP